MGPSEDLEMADNDQEFRRNQQAMNLAFRDAVRNSISCSPSVSLLHLVKDYMSYSRLLLENRRNETTPTIPDSPPSDDFHRLGRFFDEIESNPTNKRNLLPPPECMDIYVLDSAVTVIPSQNSNSSSGNPGPDGRKEENKQESPTGVGKIPSKSHKRKQKEKEEESPDEEERGTEGRQEGKNQNPPSFSEIFPSNSYISMPQRNVEIISLPSSPLSDSPRNKTDSPAYSVTSPTNSPRSTPENNVEITVLETQPAFSGFCNTQSSSNSQNGMPSDGTFSLATSIARLSSQSLLSPPSLDPDNESESDEEYQPPKPEANNFQEDNVVYSKGLGLIRCKIYTGKDGLAQSNGVIGIIFIKKSTMGPYQMLVRADNTVGTVLLNILLQKGLPLNKHGPNTIATVVPQANDNNKGEHIIIKVKTEEDAVNLFATLKELQSVV